MQVLSKQVQAKGIRWNSSMQLQIKPPTFVSNSWLTKGYVLQVKVIMGVFQNNKWGMYCTKKKAHCKDEEVFQRVQLP